MFETDQSVRGHMEEIRKNHGDSSVEMREAWKKQRPIDEANIARLVKIIETHGWPGRALAGEKGASAAFLVLQHADLAYQKKYLPLVRKAAAAGDLRTQSLALLEDRILVREGKKQIYGSQLMTNSGGKLEFNPIEDEPNVDKRRASVGLVPLAEYAKYFGLEYPPK
jgi:hypothetical protein